MTMPKIKPLINKTKKGKKLENIFKNISSDWTETLLSGFTEDEREFFINFLKKTIENASANKEKK